MIALVSKIVLPSSLLIFETKRILNIKTPNNVAVVAIRAEAIILIATTVITVAIVVITAEAVIIAVVVFIIIVALVSKLVLPC